MLEIFAHRCYEISKFRSNDSSQTVCHLDYISKCQSLMKWDALFCYVCFNAIIFWLMKNICFSESKCTDESWFPRSNPVYDEHSRDMCQEHFKKLLTLTITVTGTTDNSRQIHTLERSFTHSKSKIRNVFQLAENYVLSGHLVILMDHLAPNRGIYLLLD